MTITTLTSQVGGYEMREAGGAHRDVTQHQGIVDFASQHRKDGENTNYWGEDGFGVDDFIDIINPLQHIPVVNNIYRALTGDELSHGARMVGGTLFGGPLGFAASLANSVVQDSSGKDIGGNLIAFFTGDDGASDTPQSNAIMMADLQYSPSPNSLAYNLPPTTATTTLADDSISTTTAVAMAATTQNVVPASVDTTDLEPQRKTWAAQDNALLMADLQHSPSPNSLAYNLAPAATTTSTNGNESVTKIAPPTAVAMAPPAPTTIPAAAPAASTAFQHAAAKQAALRPSPRMTTASFDALIKSIGATPALESKPAPGWKFGAVPVLQESRPATPNVAGTIMPKAASPAAATLDSPKLHRQGLEVHHLLSKHYRSSTRNE